MGQGRSKRSFKRGRKGDSSPAHRSKVKVIRDTSTRELKIRAQERDYAFAWRYERGNPKDIQPREREVLTSPRATPGLSDRHDYALKEYLTWYAIRALQVALDAPTTYAVLWTVARKRVSLRRYGKCGRKFFGFPLVASAGGPIPFFRIANRRQPRKREGLRRMIVQRR
jgi:hypothetical protein